MKTLYNTEEKRKETQETEDTTEEEAFKETQEEF